MLGPEIYFACLLTISCCHYMGLSIIYWYYVDRHHLFLSAALIYPIAQWHFSLLASYLAAVPFFTSCSLCLQFVHAAGMSTCATLRLHHFIIISHHHCPVPRAKTPHLQTLPVKTFIWLSWLKELKNFCSLVISLASFKFVSNLSDHLTACISSRPIRLLSEWHYTKEKINLMMLSVGKLRCHEMQNKHFSPHVTHH